jgi:hypothetical protein
LFLQKRQIKQKMQVFVHQHGGDETNKLEINDLSDDCSV